MPEEVKAARTIDMLISETWTLLQSGRRPDALVKHLEFVLEEYERNELSSLPPSTLWLANEVIDLSHRQ